MYESEKTSLIEGYVKKFREALADGRPDTARFYIEKADEIRAIQAIPDKKIATYYRVQLVQNEDAYAVGSYSAEIVEHAKKFAVLWCTKVATQVFGSEVVVTLTVNPNYMFESALCVFKAIVK